MRIALSSLFICCIASGFDDLYQKHMKITKCCSMALFPSGDSNSQLAPENSTESTWLQNSSFDSIHQHTQPPDSVTSSHHSLSDPEYASPAKKAKVVFTKPKTVWLDESGLGLKDAFRVDNVPDRANLSYDSLYSGNVAKYRRKFLVTGLSSQQAVSMDDGRGKMSTKKSREKFVRYFTAELASSSDVVVKRSAAFLGEVVAIEDTPSLSGESYSSQCSAEYNKKLMDNPHNVPLWLEFIGAQDSLLNWEAGTKKRQAMTDRKIAIYERALSSNPTSVQLLLGYMSLVATCWEPKTVIKRWKELVFNQPNVPQLWLGYINFCQSNFSEFSTDSVTALYAKCISTLSMINEGCLKSHSPLDHSELWTLTIFSHYCEFLKEAGFTEKAMASYQALLELNLCTPPSLLSSPLRTVLAELEQFWASRVARLGEHGATGWMSNPTPLGPLDVPSEDSAPEEDDVAMVSGLTVKEAWLKLEAQRTREHCTPWLSDEEPLDSERLISWDALKQCLFRVTTPQLKLECVLRFLSFLGALTPPLHSPPSHPSHRTDHSHQLSSHLVSIFNCLLSDELNVPAGVVQPLLVGESIADLVSTLSGTLLHTTPLFHSPVTQTISHVCNQTFSVLPDERAQTQVALVWVTHSLREVAAALQSGDQIKEKKKAAQKLIKNLLKLKNHRNNLELWRACALIEHLLGNDCFHIFHSLLSSTLTARLVASLVEIAVGLVPSVIPRQEHTEHAQLALNALLCLSEGKYFPDTPVTASRILRARFSSQDDLFHMGLCQAYFEYLTRGVAPACKTLDQLCDALAQQRELVGSVHCKQARLLLKSPLAQPLTLRRVLCSALQVLPSNPWLLAHKALLEEQSFRVGSIHRDCSQCPEALLFAVLQELRRLERMAAVSGSSSGSLRRGVALLENSVGESPLLWQVYLAMQALVSPDKLDALFYRAVHACPGSKVLYNVGAKLLPASMLDKVVELMEDKGIRVHTPLEEVKLLLAE